MSVLISKIQQAINESVEMISNELSIRFILLIGSYARKDQGHRSDIDIAIYIDSEKHIQNSLTSALKLGGYLEKKLEREDIDIIVLNDALPSMKFNSIDENIVLFMQDEGEYEDFYVRTLSEYYDYNEFLDRQYKDAKIFIRGSESE